MQDEESTDGDDETIQPSQHIFPYDAINLPLDHEYYSDIFVTYPDCDEDKVIEFPINLQLENSTTGDHSYCTRSHNVHSIPISRPLPQQLAEEMEISQSSAQAIKFPEDVEYLEESFTLANSRMEWYGHASPIENQICDLKTQEKPYALCHICGEHFVDDDDFSIHLIEEHQQELITFPNNIFTLKHWKELQVDQSSLESTSQEISDKEVCNFNYQEETYALCHICGEQFGDNECLSFHLIEEHQQVLVTFPINIFTSNNFEEMPFFRPSMENSAEEFSNEKNFHFKYQEKTYALCHICGEHFEDDESLFIHLDWQDCAIQMQDQQEPNQQEIIHEETLCNKCGEQFVNDADLSIHLDWHDSDQSSDPMIKIQHQALFTVSDRAITSENCKINNFSKKSKNLTETEPSESSGSNAKYEMATISSGILEPPIKRASCPKCHAMFSSEHNVKKHLANNSCKKKCNSCGGSFYRRFWAKHVICCPQNQSKDGIMLHNDNQKSHDNVVGKSESEIPGLIPQSATASGYSDKPSCPKCNATFSSEYSVKKHLANNSCKKKCDSCGSKFFRCYWAKHVICCTKTQNDYLHLDNQPEPCKIPGFIYETPMAAGSLMPVTLPRPVLKRSTCPKCNKILSSRSKVRRHLAANACKKQCNTCGRKISNHFWENHVNCCLLRYQIKNNTSHQGNNKSRENDIVNSEPCKTPSFVAKSATASVSSVAPGKLIPHNSKIFDCPNCHAIFCTKYTLKIHLARNSCKIECDICGGKFYRHFWAKHIIRCPQNLPQDNKMLQRGNDKSCDGVVQNIPNEEKSPNLMGRNQELFESIWAPKKIVLSRKTANANECSDKKNDIINRNEKIVKSDDLLQSVLSNRKIIAAKKKLVLSNVPPSYVEDVFSKIFCNTCKQSLSKTDYLFHLPCSKSKSAGAIPAAKPPTTLQELEKNYNLQLECGSCDAQFPTLKRAELHNPKRCYEILHGNKENILSNVKVGLHRLTEEDVKKYQNDLKDGII